MPQSIQVILYCYHVSCNNVDKLTEDNLKTTFHTHFSFVLDEVDDFIEHVTPPTNENHFAVIQLRPYIPPPMAFCTWRLPLYNKKANSVCKTIDGETYTMTLGNSIVLNVD